MPLHPTIESVTQRIRQRSHQARKAYLDRIATAVRKAPARRAQGCANLAHALAGAAAEDRANLRGSLRPNIAIVSSYNEMLSAHQPYVRFPQLIQQAAREAGAVAQFAGGVPAMCDGITQGTAGMELSLYSRDVIAMSTAIALSHDVFDAALLLGVCDKIVPGLLIGALQFGHLPAIFVPAGPMRSGLSNRDKVKVRQLHAEGRLGREALLEAECQAYHGAGTCTFYGTANSNQMLMELMGLHLPGAAFVHPDTPLRDALTAAAAQRLAKMTALGDTPLPLGHIVDERAIVNGIVGLLATGGSTNHTIHLIAIAAAAGLRVDWDDFDALSTCVPLLARIYPNGSADVNQFHAAGGIGFVIRELLDAGLLHEDVQTVMGQGLRRYVQEPSLQHGRLVWQPAPTVSHDLRILRHADEPFSAEGGLRLVQGRLGRAVIKSAAVDPAHWRIEAPARVFDDQEQLLQAYREGRLYQDFVAVLRWQGPRACGMPELHKLMPVLGALQDRGYRVALVTDGRMSGASGKVPAAIHLSPECAAGGWLARVQDGDRMVLDVNKGLLEVLVSTEELERRTVAAVDLSSHQHGMGRELFSLFRRGVSGAESGALCFDAWPQRVQTDEGRGLARAEALRA